MKTFKMRKSTTDLWDWLHTDKNYEELNQALGEFSKCAEIVKNKVDYLKKIDKFRNVITALKTSKKEDAETHKKTILDATDALVDYIGEPKVTDEIDKNEIREKLYNAYNSIQNINTIK